MSHQSDLCLAVRIGNKLLIEQLLGVDSCKFLDYPNRDGKTLLHEAVQFGSVEIVELLCQKGADINALKRGDWTPLMLASAKQNLPIIRTLVEAGAILSFCNKDGWTAFHIACRAGESAIIKYFLEVDENIWDCKSKNGRTPLHTAALHGHSEIVKILLQECQANERDCCGNTPFMDCVRSGSMDALKTMLNYGLLDIKIKDNMGREAFHLAAEAGHAIVLSYLVDHCHLDVNILTNTGQSALHFACKEGHLNVIQCLIDLGANVNIVDAKGRTCLWMANLAKKQDCFELLMNSGAVMEPNKN